MSSSLILPVMLLVVLMNDGPLSSLVHAQQQQQQQQDSSRIAVIGGGISGTFVSKYLVDLNSHECSIAKLDIYDPASSQDQLGSPITKENSQATNQQQGSRVGTYQMDDGRIIELGASIFIDKFRYIIDMINNDPSLTIGKPFDTNTGQIDENMKTGMGIYNGGTKIDQGNDDGGIVFNTANITDPYDKKMAMLWRYNLDVILVNWLVEKTVAKFEMLQEKLKKPTANFYGSPQEMWTDVGLSEHVEMSLDDFLDMKLNSWTGFFGDIVPKDYVPWFRKWLFSGQGPLRHELLSAINLVNYNQDNSQINALSGLGSFSVASSKIHSLQGGNNQIIKSAYHQTRQNLQKNCPASKDHNDVIQHIPTRIATVIGHHLGTKGFELFDDNGTSLGEYDIVIMAVPYSMANIDFLVRSHIDESVLQPMSLGGLIEAHDEESSTATIPDDHEGHYQLPKEIPLGVQKPYTQVVTTIVKNGVLQPTYFGFPNGIHKDLIPRGIYSTPSGKASMAYNNITSIAQIASQDGLYKVFSSQSLSQDTLNGIFGGTVEVEYEKIWGGTNGGATPDFATLRQNQSPYGTPFLLWDGALGSDGHDTKTSGGLYYPNSLELTFACIELSAMGATAVAKLIAKRYRWNSVFIDNDKDDETGSEL